MESETCAIMSIKVTYKIDHISLLWDSTISSALNRNLKEKDHIKRNINGKKKCLYRKSIIFWFVKNQSQSSPHNKQLSCLCLSIKSK